MKKILLICITFLIFINYVSGKESSNEYIEYGILLGQVGEVNEIILSGKDFHPLRKDKEEIKLYNYELINPYYITNGTSNIFNTNKINIIEFSNQLGYFEGGYEENYIKPIKGNYVILDYLLNKKIDKTYLNNKEYQKELSDIKEIYIKSNAYINGFKNIDSIFTKIECDISDFSLFLNYIKITNYENKDEKEKKQLRILKEQVFKKIKCTDLINKNNKTWFDKIIDFFRGLFIYF